MKNVYFPLILGSIMALNSLNGLPGQAAPMLFEKERSKANIRINNRVLAMVNQKPITVLDVVKQMDLVFYKQYPQYADVPELRYQFYTMSWKAALQELVDKELILADAEEVKMDISGADLRQEIEETFGPNVVSSLDNAGLTMEEAMDMVKNDMILRRMMYVRVQSKALRDVTPSEIRLAYDRYKNNYNAANEWRFHVVTIRDPSAQKLGKIASKLDAILQNESLDLDDVKSFVKKCSESNVFTAVKISDELEQNEDDIAPRYLDILKELTPGSYSSPQLQTKSDTPCYKILYLKDVIYDEVPPFALMSGKLKSELLSRISSEESIEYKKRLRRQFPVSQMDELLASEFSPFAIE